MLTDLTVFFVWFRGHLEFEVERIRNGLDHMRVKVLVSFVVLSEGRVLVVRLAPKTLPFIDFNSIFVNVWSTLDLCAVSPKTASYMAASFLATSYIAASTATTASSSTKPAVVGFTIYPSVKSSQLTSIIVRLFHFCFP